MNLLTPRILIRHGLFFLATLITTTLAGAEWMFPGSFISSEHPLGFSHFLKGFQFSLPFLAVLTIHEFGHYFVARYYKLEVTLPLYLPLWLGFLGIPSIGTAGAFIKLKSQPHSRKEYFDVGVAGPLAGFIAALCLLWYAFTHLPPPEYIFGIHPEYMQYGTDYAKHAYKGTAAITLGNSLLFSFFTQHVADPALLPNPYELMHYPYVLAGYLSLLFTALNLLPIGQLDGGHVLYGLAGKKIHQAVAPVILIILVLYSGIGQAAPIDLHYDKDLSDKLFQDVIYLGVLYFAFSGITPVKMNVLLIALSVFAVHYAGALFLPQVQGYNGWMMFALIVGKFLGVYHPKALIDTPLPLGRKAIGWFALAVFVLCCTPSPLNIVQF